MAEKINSIITIGRQYGSAGREIGYKLADYFGIKLYDKEMLAVAAKEFGVIFEINEASLAPYGYRGDTRANNREILKYCMKYEIPIVLSSDSHGAEHIGDFKYAAEFVHEMMFPEKMILNNDIPRLKMILSER